MRRENGFARAVSGAGVPPEVFRLPRAATLAVRVRDSHKSAVV